jgi:F420-dependent oxidoreductase-like protein
MARFGIKTPTQHTTFEEMRNVWREADQIDVFESAWNWDHLYPLRGDPHGTTLEGWTSLAALAQATQRLRVGCMVTGMHFRHPALTAKMAATVDQISSGRLILGLGAGWFEPEAEANGVSLGTVKERIDRFEEGIEVIVSLLTNEVTDFDGEFYRLTGARSEPKPEQRPHPPILIGGTGRRRMLRAVARYAQIWDALFTSPEDWTQLRDVLAEHCEQVGRDISEITCSVHLAYAADDDVSRLADEAAARFEQGVDLVVFTMRSPYHVSMVEPLAEALAVRSGHHV